MVNKLVNSYSVLGSLYHRESAIALRMCLESLVAATQSDQVQVVLVQDGPIGADLLAVVDDFRSRLHIVDVILPVNVGLGAALNAGLQYCSNDLVGRFDTDDVYPVDRFKLQIAEFMRRPELAVLGGWISEFETTPECCHAERCTPLSHDEIEKMARRRNPFNHMTVMFRKSSVQSCGGYGQEFLFEDYGLWVRMLSSGFKVANLPNCLAFARAGFGMYERRGGWRYALSEIKLFYGFYRIGFLSLPRMIGGIFLRVPIRLLPAGVRGFIYRFMLRGSNF